MDMLATLWNWILALLPALIVLLLFIGCIRLIQKFAIRRDNQHAEKPVRTQIVLLAVSVVGLIAVILALPMNDSTRGQLLGLIGIVLSAVLALSATTFVGNALAGMMLRAVGSFHPGDFIRISDHFGRVSDRGLFHTEIQNEDRDLTTLPNLYLVTNPVKVVRSSGTFISAEVSLGYDVPHAKAEAALIKAVEAAQLSDPFVMIVKLGDFSITYRATGLLKEVKRVISSRSRLYAEMLDALHRDGIEIVSPTFMNTRVVGEQRFIPADDVITHGTETVSGTEPEEIVFDKAEAAASLEQLRRKLSEVEHEIQEAEEKLSDASQDKAKAAWEQRLDLLNRRRDWLNETVRAREAGGRKE